MTPWVVLSNAASQKNVVLAQYLYGQKQWQPRGHSATAAAGAAWLLAGQGGLGLAVLGWLGKRYWGGVATGRRTGPGKGVALPGRCRTWGPAFCNPHAAAGLLWGGQSALIRMLLGCCSIPALRLLAADQGTPVGNREAMETVVWLLGLTEPAAAGTGGMVIDVKWVDDDGQLKLMSRRGPY